MSDDDELPGPPDCEALEQDVGEAISRILNIREGGFVIKWLALVETSDRDGRRGLWTLSSPEVLAWDTVGMLTHALHLQQAQVLHEVDDDGP